MELHENLVVADRFRLVRMIGRGGMGTVWEAVQIALEQPCALKFIDEKIGDVADAHARFEREAKAAAQLRSPNVVQILDHGVWQGRPYIAMELLEGEDLGQTIAAAGNKLPPARIVGIVEQVCRALTKAHQCGIVYRDLKPDNVFLVRDDDREIVKVLDFGVAKQTQHGVDSHTKTGAMLGTPYYMSPEQAQGVKKIDSRSDLWSLAVIVYQCVTGRRPFDSDALGDLLVKIIVEPVPVPSHFGPVPPGFDAWWLKAAQRNPDHRFATAKDFAGALALALGVTGPNAHVDVTRPSHPMVATAMMHGPLGPHTPPPGHPSAPPPSGPVPNAVTGNPVAPPAVANAAMGSSPPGPPAHTTPYGAHPPSQPPSGAARLDNPATFSGIEPAAAQGNKPPLAMIGASIVGAITVLALLAVGVQRVAQHASAAASSSAIVEPSATAPTTTAVVPAAPSAEPPPSASTAPLASASASASASPGAAVDAPRATAATAAAPTMVPRADTASPPSTARAQPDATPAAPKAPGAVARPATTAVAPGKTQTTSETKPTIGDDRKW